MKVKALDRQSTMLSLRGSGNVIITRQSDRVVITATESKGACEPVEQWQVQYLNDGTSLCTHYLSTDDIIVGS